MAETSSEQTPELERVIVRSYPKSIYLWPSMLTGFIIYLIDFTLNSILMTPPADSMEFEAYLASIWIIVLAFNIIIISFDFSLGKSFTLFITIAFFVLIFVIVQGALNIDIPVISFSLKETLQNSNINASPVFYLVISIILLLIYIAIFISSRFNYWVFESNRIIHHKGFFEREENFSAQNSRVVTMTDDIFERLLFRAGTVTIIDPRNGVHILSNVYNAVNKDKQIQELLSFIRVKQATN